MKKNYVLVFSLLLISYCSFSQGRWTWISGDSTLNSLAVFGTRGVPSVNNHPPAIYDALEWKDKQGNFWIYGGTIPLNTDLWKFNPTTLEWTWVKGNGTANQSTVYGTKGVPNAANTPGQRSYTALTWVDTSGALWLFGGAGQRDDLWKYDISSGNWTWIKGDTNTISNPQSVSVHGIMGTPNLLNTPGNRYSTASAWTDSLNNLWLFGGFGFDDDTMAGGLDDMWKYNISSNEWTWMKGTSGINPHPDYNTKGVASASSTPGERFGYSRWKDAQDNFWFMGGLDYNEDLGVRNDVWKYDISKNNWIWMSGPNFANDTGNYHAGCIYDTLNTPASRWYNRSAATDNCGRFWLFGGNGPNNNLNDLWVFDPQQVKWNLVRNNDTLAIYGNLGVPLLSNIPCQRMGSVAWWGNDNRFYMFGGESGVNTNILSDMWVFNPDTSCVPSCNSVVIPPPVAAFQASKTMLCANDCISFTDSSMNATSWQWRFAGAADSTSAIQNPQNICYPTAGNYNVTLIASNSGGKDSVMFSNYIHVIPSPPTPVISQIGKTLYCSTDPSYTSYKWFLDSVLIPGATDTFLVITTGGNYNVEVTNDGGCFTATGINIVLGILNYSLNNIISLSPNPTRNELRIESAELRNETIEIYNILGEKIYNKRLEILNTKQETIIDVSSLSPGIYFVRDVSESRICVGRFVKE